MRAWLRDHRLAASAGLAIELAEAADVVTYVVEGALAQADPDGATSVLRAGEVRAVCGRAGQRLRATNACGHDATRVVFIGLPCPWLGPPRAGRQERFCAGERRNRLRLLASPEAALAIDSDARLYSALLDPGQHVVHPLAPGRTAWLQVVSGGAQLGDRLLEHGRAALVRGQAAVSLTARGESEILLCDAADDAVQVFS